METWDMYYHMLGANNDTRDTPSHFRHVDQVAGTGVTKRHISVLRAHRCQQSSAPAAEGVALHRRTTETAARYTIVCHGWSLLHVEKMHMYNAASRTKQASNISKGDTSEPPFQWLFLADLQPLLLVLGTECGLIVSPTSEILSGLYLNCKASHLRRKGVTAEAPRAVRCIARKSDGALVARVIVARIAVSVVSFPRQSGRSCLLFIGRASPALYVSGVFRGLPLRSLVIRGWLLAREGGKSNLTPPRASTPSRVVLCYVRCLGLPPSRKHEAIVLHVTHAGHVSCYRLFTNHRVFSKVLTARASPCRSFKVKTSHLRQERAQLARPWKPARLLRRPVRRRQEVVDPAGILPLPYDGTSKRLNRTLKQYLSSFGTHNQRDWESQVPPFLLAYCSPNTGRAVRCTIDIVVVDRRQRQPRDDRVLARLAKPNRNACVPVLRTRLQEMCVKALFSDECRFELYSRLRIRVCRTPTEKFLPECLSPAVQQGGGSVMAWGCMSMQGTGFIRFTDGSMIDESEIRNHAISLVQHFYVGTKIKLDPGSERGSFYLGSGEMLMKPGIRRASQHQGPGVCLPLPQCASARSMRVIEVSMEQCRNERAEETGDPQENPPTSVIVRHDSRMRKSGSDPAGYRTRGILRVDEGEASLVLSSAGMQGRGNERSLRKPGNQTMHFIVFASPNYPLRRGNSENNKHINELGRRRKGRSRHVKKKDTQQREAIVKPKQNSEGHPKPQFRNGTLLLHIQECRTLDEQATQNPKAPSPPFRKRKPFFHCRRESSLALSDITFRDICSNNSPLSQDEGIGGRGGVSGRQGEAIIDRGLTRSLLGRWKREEGVSENGEVRNKVIEDRSLDLFMLCHSDRLAAILEAGTSDL
ncbi:hypothetical protein PR048_002900 [Dryococelus australis]|uniref:Uncharacterized protein n=1 Tax=Dryococelus australis TaxID=614101 RepID=A0ABQ9ILL0_9NEOP|nr:hypothetical protein PR048_002900 [Dryococelus australis]